MKQHFLFLFLLFFTSQIQGQSIIKGRVMDYETQSPLEMAAVTVTHRTGSTVYKYALTDPNGYFSFSVSEDEEWMVHVTYLGYKKESRAAFTGKEMLFRLKPEAISMKEVEIKGGRIYGRQDTVRYDLTRFISSTDQNIKETLKKLPGIDINDQNGEIRYNGKAISQFTIEGMDISGGKYNQITDNLKADAVEKAEIIEHFQPIRSLRNKIPTDNVALNLRLKPEIRSRWLLTLQAAAGYNDQTVYSGKLNALQLARKKQGIYSYKLDNTGKELATELQQLTTESQNFIASAEVPTFIDPPTFSFPLEKQRLMDNTTHLLSLSRLYRKNEEKQSRFTLNYLYDNQQRTQGTEETYYYPTDTLCITQEQAYSLATHTAQATYSYEQNSEHSFLRNLLEVDGAWKTSQEDLQGNQELSQNLQTANIQLTNRLNALTTRENSTYGFRSFFRYAYRPTTLQFGEVYQSLNFQQAYTDNQAYYQSKKNGLTLKITGGLQGELFFLNQHTTFSSHQFKVYATPMLMWERNSFRLTASADAEFIRKPNQQYTDIRVNPTATLHYQLNSRWELVTRAQFQQRSEEVTAFYPESYWQNYRTFVSLSPSVPEVQNQLYTFYLTYKRTVNEFFWTLSGSYWSQHNQQLTHSEYQNNVFTFTTWDISNRNYGYQLNSILSKGFYEWHLKTSLESQLIFNEGKQASLNSLQDYQYTLLTLTPKISWTPLWWLDIAYQARLTNRYSVIDRNKDLPSLWDIRQKINLGIGNRLFHIQLIGEHYYNQLNKENHQHVWLTDVEVSYTHGKWRFCANLRNLLNQKEYRYTTYSAIQQYTSRIKMRPREFIISAQYQL